jgi:hypothetical protein
MLHLTDLLSSPERSFSDSVDYLLPHASHHLLSRVATTSLPVLCLDCYGVAFLRVASELHRKSGRDELVLVDLRRNGGTLPAGLPDRARAARTTLALDGLEHLDEQGQLLLARQLAAAPCRLVSATDIALEDLRQLWPFDLLAIVSTITVHAPALARRGGDIAALARHRLALLCGALGRSVPELSAQVVDALVAHDWPGDLNELDTVLARSAMLSDGSVLEIDDLRLQLAPPSAGPPVVDVSAAPPAKHAATAAAPSTPPPVPLGSRCDAGGEDGPATRRKPALQRVPRSPPAHPPRSRRSPSSSPTS